MGSCISIATGINYYNNLKKNEVVHTDNISGQVVQYKKINNDLFNLVTMIYFTELPIIELGRCKKKVLLVIIIRFGL